MADALVLGYGSDLRGDDAAGRHVARRIAALDLPGVRARGIHQLTPELAAEIAECRTVIFVDAAVDIGDVEVRRLPPGDVPSSSTHHADPAGLLALAQQAFGTAPAATLITVPAVEFEIGERLSPATRKGIEVAVAEIRRELQGAC